MKKHFIIALFVFFLLNLSACASSNNAITETDFAFDTYISITVYNKKDAKLIDKAFELCHEFDALLSKTDDTSDIYKLENNRNEYVEVSEHSIKIIEIYKELYDSSNKKLDCTVGKLSNLWNFKEISDSIPDKNQIIDATKDINLDKLSINQNQACLFSDSAMLDFGAVAKGYIADRVKDFLIKNDVENAILNFGGNVLTIGSRPDGNNYNVGIQMPYEDKNEVICSVSVSDKAVVTAGIYERYIESEGNIYHHILDPVTGYSADTDLLSATIICDNAAYGDAYSTICILLGKEKALELINNTDQMEAILVDNNKEIIYSDGASKYINKE